MRAQRWPLRHFGLVLPARVHERLIYAETFAHGKTALEIEPEGAAAQEIMALWHQLRDKIAEKKTS